MIIKLNHFTTIAARMKLTLRNTITLGAAVLVASCASAPTKIVHETVGPSPTVVNEEHNGFLKVYSATASMVDDDGPSLLKYTNYRIDAADGTIFREVANDDQEPTRVILPKGTYTVVARSDTSGMVSVPVAIETGKTTVLHLEREKDWKEAPAGIDSADLVRLPNGQPIGFRARHAELLKSPIVRVAQSR
jgi:hypothetical protein